MSTTLSYGYLQPSNGDPGSVWFPDLNTNIQKLNDHNHDGVNSALAGFTLSAPSASWVADGVGKYKQLLTLPTGYDIANLTYMTKIASGSQVFATIEKVTSDTVYVYTCDNTLNYEVIFR